MARNSGIRINRELVLRIAPSIAAALVYLGLALLWRLQHGAYVAVMDHFISTPVSAPYGDLGAVLRATFCWRHGVNVYQPSACMLGGVYNYSPFLLRAGWFGVEPGMQDVGGLLLGSFFILSCCLLPPPNSVAETVLRSVALCSGVVAHALESGNVDSLLFSLSLIGVWLLGRRGVVSLGYTLFALCGALKFYPAAMLALVAREAPRRLAVIGGLVLLCGLVFLAHYGATMLTAMVMLPAGLPFRGSFGALNIPFGLGLLAFMPVLTIDPNVPDYFAAINHSGMAMYLVVMTKLLTVAGLVAGVQLAPRYAEGLRALEEPRRLFLVAGSLVLCVCFYIAPNYDYRAVYLLLLLPGLYAMRMANGVQPRSIAVLVVALLWERLARALGAWTGVAVLGKHAVYLEIAIWLVREYFWWWLIVRLTAIVICFLRDAPVLRRLA